jgi:predicted flavoprotein YhiN
MPEQVVVIGAGASGMIAAGRAAERGAQVLLLEKMDQPGKKLLISGKARCNLTNARDLDNFIAMYGVNGRFLHGAFSQFFREDLLELLRRYGVETKTERGGRIFPASDDARDVLKALEHYMDDHGVKVRTNARVTGIQLENGRVTGVMTGAETYPATALILAAGGCSFPATGSAGDGYALAREAGHTVSKLRPALVPLVVNEVERARSMQGVSLRNVRLTSFSCRADEINGSPVPAKDTGRGLPGRRPRPPVIESRMGEMMMTHFGIGGPITLQMSLAVVEALEKGPVSVAIDFKPALSEAVLRERLQRDLDTYSQRSYRHILKGLLPQKLVDPFVEMTGIPPDRQGHEIAAEERGRLLHLLKSLRFNIKSSLPISTAMVTAGGVSLNEIEPRSMASRLAKGLFLCGEVIDIDAETGGYNLQAAFSTGYVAGEHAAGFVRTTPP